MGPYSPVYSLCPVTSQFPIPKCIVGGLCSIDIDHKGPWASISMCIFTRLQRMPLDASCHPFSIHIKGWVVAFCDKPTHFTHVKFYYSTLTICSFFFFFVMALSSAQSACNPILEMVKSNAQDHIYMNAI